MANLTLGFLGGLQVATAKAPTAVFESDKTRALLAYLSVESACPHRRETLIGLLWPDCPESAARRNLRQTLYDLRNAIGDHEAMPPHLLVSRDDIQFNRASSYVLDVELFQARLAAASAHTHSGLENCVSCAALFADAVGLYRGDFLEHFFLKDSAEFEEWALVHRESLHRCALEALGHLANYHQGRGEHEQAQSYLQRQLALDPWREEAHRQMMRLLAENGQRSTAIVQYHTCREVLNDELGVEPSPETKALYEQIVHGELRGPARRAGPISIRPPLPLPVQLTHFVGREHELAALGNLLADDKCRLITLTGPGGAGKTRLALEAAARFGAGFPEGVAFVPLAPVSSIEGVLPAIAQSLGFALYGSGDPQVQLLNYLREKRLLLILDNVEHLPEAAELWLEMLQVPQTKLLLTSREPVNLQGEWLLAVEGLQFPEGDDVAEMEKYPSVALFVQRARRARVGFSLGGEDRRAVLRICRLVGGMPLALELAATWTRTLSCREILQEMERDLDFLSTSVRDLPQRHRSMRAVIDQSWKMLSADEQHALQAMSVFRGGFEREAAAAVAGANLSLLSTLQAKSLLGRTPGGRYDLHELVRQYAAAKLEQAPDDQRATEERHSSYYIDFVQRREKDLKSARQSEALKELSQNIENIHAAWRRAVRRGALAEVQKPLRAFWLLYEMRGWFKEAEAQLGWAVAELESLAIAPAQRGEKGEVLRAYLRAQQGWFCIKLGKLEEARGLLERSAGALGAFRRSIELMHTLHYLWALEWATGHLARARELSIEQLEMAEELGDQWEIAFAQAGDGRTAYMLGEHHEALERLESASASFRAIGDQAGAALCLCYLGPVQLKLGLAGQARDSLRESIELAKAIGDRWSMAKSLNYLGLVAEAQGDLTEAAALLRQSLELFLDMGDRANIVASLEGLGRALLALDADAEAQDAFFQALDLAREIGFLPALLETLLGIGRLQLKRGETDAALLLFGHILNHASTTPELRERAEPLRREAESQLNPRQVEAARNGARAKSTETILRELQMARR